MLELHKNSCMHFHADLRHGGMNEVVANDSLSCLHSALEITPICFYLVLERILCRPFTEVGTPVSPTL